MIKENAPAKSRLSSLINRAAAGEDVCVCKNGVPVVKLVPVRSVREGTPCGVIRELTVTIKGDIAAPPDEDSWGNLT